MILESLKSALLELADECETLTPPFLVGGGFGLYLKQQHVETVEGLETLIPGELWPPARATNDLDLFLPTELLIRPEQMQTVRDALDRLGYVPVVNYMQFVRGGPVDEVKVDILTPRVPDDLKPQVRSKPPRVRPRGVAGLHAFETEEAVALEDSPCELPLSGMGWNGKPVAITVRLPNPFTYLLMKVHALRDRVQRGQGDRAIHHALDIYRIVAMLTREEYDLVRRLTREHAGNPTVVVARRAAADLFLADRAHGIPQLVSGARRAGLDPSRLKMEDFRGALREVLAPDA